jgi:hypothetical protein
MAPNDNHSHLQALRTMSVLAAEPRCLECRDADSSTLLTTSLELLLRSGSMLQMESPCLLPPLDRLVHVRVVDSDSFYPRTLLHTDAELKQLVLILKRRRSQSDHRARALTRISQDVEDEDDDVARFLEDGRESGEAPIVAPVVLNMDDRLLSSTHFQDDPQSDRENEFTARRLRAYRSSLALQEIREELYAFLVDTKPHRALTSSTQVLLQWLQWPSRSSLQGAFTASRTTALSSVAFASQLRHDDSAMHACSALAVLTLAELLLSFRAIQR